MLIHKQSTEKVQSCVLYELSLPAVSDMYHRSWKYESILTLSVIIIIIIYSHGRAMQYSFFLSFWAPSKNSASFLKLIFLAVLSPPTLYKVETQKKFWIHASNIVCGVRGGVGPVWIGNAQKCKSVPRLLSMIVVGR